MIAPTPGMELAVSVDMLVEGRHFFAGTDAERARPQDPRGEPVRSGGDGRRAALRAAGGCAARRRRCMARRDSCAAFARWPQRYDVELVGGDTTRGPRNLCVTVIGEVPRGQRITRARCAARATTSTCPARLGGAALALRAHARRPPAAADALERVRARLERPQPRVALGLALRGIATRGARRLRRPRRRPCAHPRSVGRAARSISLARVPADAAVADLLQRRRTRRSRWSACWPAATTTSCASPRRAARAIASKPWRASWRCPAR